MKHNGTVKSWEANLSFSLSLTFSSLRSLVSQVLYYEVGNLNTETYPGSADLPTYVTQNCGFKGDVNTDRLIISYQVRSKEVEAVYVTKHVGDFSGSFSSDDTYEISSELIQILQSPDMDLTSFLTQMGFYYDIPVVPWCDGEENYNYYDQQIYNSYTGSAVSTEQSNISGWFSASLNHETTHSNISVNVHNSYVTSYSGVEQNYYRPEPYQLPRTVWQSYNTYDLEPSWDSKGEDKFVFI